MLKSAYQSGNTLIHLPIVDDLVPVHLGGSQTPAMIITAKNMPNILMANFMTYCHAMLPNAAFWRPKF